MAFEGTDARSIYGNGFINAGSIIDLEPTPENFDKYKAADKAFAIMAMQDSAGNFLLPGGYSPWDHSEKMVEYEQ